VANDEDELPGDEAPPQRELPEDASDPVVEIPVDEAAFLDEGFAAVPAGTNTALPPRIEAWRKRSAAGAILTGFALGLQEALENRKEEPGIVMQTSGEPPKDLPVEADFEYGRPRQSVVQIRPWLLGDQPAAAETAAAETAAPSGDGEDPEGEDRASPAGDR
jgi:hypothetical protein